MSAATKKLCLSVNHLLSAIEQVKLEAIALLEDPDLRDLKEDIRVGAGIDLKDFLNFDKDIEELETHLNNLRVAALVRELDPSLNKPDQDGRPWTAVVREKALFRTSGMTIQSVRHALGLDMSDAKIAITLYQSGKL